MKVQEFVMIYMQDKNSKSIYYIHKEKPSMPFLDGKYTGVGGRIENGEKPIDALIREIDEELEFSLSKDYIQDRGKFIDKKGNTVYVYYAEIGFEIDERYIDDEGWFVKMPQNYHIDHPEEFPENNPIVIKSILENSDKIDFDFQNS